MKIITKLLDALKLDLPEKSENNFKASSENITPDAQMIYFKNGKLFFTKA